MFTKPKSIYPDTPSASEVVVTAATFRRSWGAYAARRYVIKRLGDTRAARRLYRLACQLSAGERA